MPTKNMIGVLTLFLIFILILFFSIPLHPLSIPIHDVELHMQICSFLQNKQIRLCQSHMEDDNISKVN